MPDTKITALTAIGANPIIPSTFPIPMVDLTDTSMAASGTTKKVTVNQILGAGGTATLASATITGNLTVDTNTFFADSANNRVGIGTASPAVLFHAALPAATFGEVGRFYDSSGNGISFTANASSGFNQITSTGSQPLIVNVNSSERYRIASDGVATWSNVGGVAGTAMTLNANGLGIGVTPSAWGSNYKSIDLVGGGRVFTVSGTGTHGFSFNAFNNNTNWLYQFTTVASRFELQQSGNFAWLTAPSGTAGTAITFTQAMTLDASGNLLVGTTTNTDAYRTNIQFSGTSVNGLIVKNLASTGGPVLLYLHDSAQTVNTATVSAEYTDSTTQRWRLYKNGGLANYQANNVNLSDVRTKTDIKPIGSYWNKIKSLEVVTFKYKDQTHSDDNIGLIAQQVESVAPELVDADGFGNTPEDGVPLKTIYTTDLYHAAIKALQEAMARIEALEAKLA